MLKHEDNKTEWKTKIYIPPKAGVEITKLFSLSFGKVSKTSVRFGGKGLTRRHAGLVATD